MHELGNWRHLCVDMQRLFAEDTPWHVGWMGATLPAIAEIAGRHAARTVFTRFIAPSRPEDMRGLWKAYYEKWWMITREHMPPDMFDLAAPLARLVPPAAVFDKQTYSPWLDGRLHAALTRDGVDSLVITGGETDVCVLATVLGAIDLGYRVLLVKDAVCSGSDGTHDASLALLANRFSVQLRLLSTDELLPELAE